MSKLNASVAAHRQLPPSRLLRDEKVLVADPPSLTQKSQPRVNEHLPVGRTQDFAKDRPQRRR